MRSTITSYRDLAAWQQSMDLATACYRASSQFPKAEQYGLASQLRRAAVSIPSNIAEGHRKSRPSFVNHLRLAAGSHAEVETQVELALRLGFVSQESAAKVFAQAEDVGRLIHGLLRSLIPNP